MHAAQVVVIAPSVGPIEMTITVPPGPDGRRRICTHAQVMARYYEARVAKTVCAWCTEEIAGAGVFFHPEEGPTRGPYCSSSCFMAAL